MFLGFSPFNLFIASFKAFSETFETTGLEVKAARLSPAYFDYDWFSYPEEWERYFQDLQQLPNRSFYAKHKIEGGILPLQTAEILPAYEEIGIEKDRYDKILEETFFGKKYLRKRKKISKEIKKEPLEKRLWKKRRNLRP
ncbi:MAG: hypothetical protein U9O89_07095 [Thermoproteota archaeon]|nr:hypothetical protein [Thermoproteota archaeon]